MSKLIRLAGERYRYRHIRTDEEINSEKQADSRGAKIPTEA